MIQVRALPEGAIPFGGQLRKRFTMVNLSLSGLGKAHDAVTYDVLGELPGFSIGALRDAVSQSFSLWSEETPLAFVRRAQQPTLTVTFLPLGVGGGLGNAGIEINSSMSWRYRPGPQQQNSYDLVTVLAHEIGHRLGLDHSLDPASVMFEALGQRREIRTLPGVDIGSARERLGSANVVEVTGVHGTSVAIENPAQVRNVIRRGPHAEIHGHNASAWFHFAPPSLSRAADKGLRLHSVLVRARTEAQTAIRELHVWDGNTFRQRHRLDLRGSGPGAHEWDLRLGVARKPLVSRAIGISVNVDFIDAGSRQVNFISAGCEFVSEESVIDPREEGVFERDH